MERTTPSDPTFTHHSDREKAVMSMISDIADRPSSDTHKEIMFLRLHEMLKAERKSLSADPNADQRTKDENIRLSLIVARSIKALQVERQKKAARFKKSETSSEHEASKIAEESTPDSKDTPAQEKIETHGSRKQYLTTILSIALKNIEIVKEKVQSLYEKALPSITQHSEKAKTSFLLFVSEVQKEIDDQIDITRRGLEDKKKDIGARYNRAVSDTILFIKNYTRACTALIKRVVPTAAAIVIAPTILVSGQNSSNLEPRFSKDFNTASAGNISDQKPKPANGQNKIVSNNLQKKSIEPKPLAFIPQPKAQVQDRSQYPVKVRIPSLKPPRDVEGIVNTAIAEWVESADYKTYGFYADGIRQRSKVSCSSFIRNVIGNVNKHASEVGMSIPTRTLPYNSAELVSYVSKANKQAPRKLSSGKELLKLKPGDIVGVDSGVDKHKYDKGIDHILIIYRDPHSQRLMIAESTSRRDKKDGKTGVQSLSVEDYLVLLEKRRHWKFYVTPVTALLQEKPDAINAIIEPRKRQAHISSSKAELSRAETREDVLLQKFRTAESSAYSTPYLTSRTNERRVAEILNGKADQFEQAVQPPRM